jgi:hypothetical protein
MRGLLAIFMTALVLGLVACGDDNNDSSSATTGTNAQSTGTTGTTTTGKTTSTGKSDDKGGSSKDKSGSSGSSKSDDNSSSGSSNSGSSKSKSKSKSGSSGSGSSGSSTQGKINGGKEPDAPKEPELTAQNVKATAKRVCSQFLPNQIKSDLKRGKTTNDKVARAYSKGYPAKQRDDAYAGCLAGLKARKD